MAVKKRIYFFWSHDSSCSYRVVHHQDFAVGARAACMVKSLEFVIVSRLFQSSGRTLLCLCERRDPTLGVRVRYVTVVHVYDKVCICKYVDSFSWDPDMFLFYNSSCSWSGSE